MALVTKYFIQLQKPCPHCKRPSVDIVSTSDKEGLMFSRHFPSGKFSFCANSFVTLER